MQNTVRDSQPVSWSDIEQVIRTNPHRSRKLDPVTAAAAGVIQEDSKATAINWMPAGWTYANSSFLATPLSLAIMATDPLYEISATNTRRSMEKEAAMELAVDFDTMYGKYGGRSRGWVKTNMSK